MKIEAKPQVSRSKAWKQGDILRGTTSGVFYILRRDTNGGNVEVVSLVNGVTHYVGKGFLEFYEGTLELSND